MTVGENILFDFLVVDKLRTSVTVDADILRAILRESEAKLEMKNFKAPSIFVWR